nr:MAG TPA: hypothetical protein [Bacteriophage sp.]
MLFCCAWLQRLGLLRAGWRLVMGRSPTSETSFPTHPFVRYHF